MFRVLLEKELKSIILSPKFAVTFGVFSVLLLLSAFIGIKDYHASVRQYETAVQLENQEIAETTSWNQLDVTVHREPDPLHILAAGVSYDVGRLASADEADSKLRQSFYSDDTIFALFRFIDFAFIIQVVLSLFAILFTYDAVSGERERGTLRLQLSSAVPRPTYVLAKISGTWVGLIVPLLIPIGLVALMITVLNVPMEPTHWYRFMGIVGVSFLYFTVFVALGVLISSLTRLSRVSFLGLLVIWVVGVLIVPRASTMAAAQLVKVPSVAEVESAKDRYRLDRREDYRDELVAAMRQSTIVSAGNTEQELDSLREAQIAMQRSIRELMYDDIRNHQRLLDEDLRNRRHQQERIAFSLSRFSPPAAYQLAVVNIAGTSPDLKARYESAAAAHGQTLTDYRSAKQAEESTERELAHRTQNSTIMIRLDGGDEPVDATDMPRFQAPEVALSPAIRQSVIDIGVLALYSLIFIGGAFVAFSRYDVR